MDRPIVASGSTASSPSKVSLPPLHRAMPSPTSACSAGAVLATPPRTTRRTPRSSPSRPTSAAATDVETLARLAHTGELRAIVAQNRATLIKRDELRQRATETAAENEIMKELVGEKHQMLTNSDLAVILSTVMTKPDGTANSAILDHRKPPQLRCRAAAQQRLLLCRSKIDGGLVQPSQQLASPVSPSVERREGAERAGVVVAVGDDDTIIAPAAAAEGKRRRLIGDPEDDDALAVVPEADRPALVVGKTNYRVMREQQREMLEDAAASRRAYDGLMRDFISKQRSITLFKLGT